MNGSPFPGRTRTGRGRWGEFGDEAGASRLFNTHGPGMGRRKEEPWCQARATFWQVTWYDLVCVCLVVQCTRDGVPLIESLTGGKTASHAPMTTDSAVSLSPVLPPPTRPCAHAPMLVLPASSPRPVGLPPRRTDGPTARQPPRPRPSTAAQAGSSSRSLLPAGPRDLHVAGTSTTLGTAYRYMLRIYQGGFSIEHHRGPTKEGTVCLI